MKERPFFKTAVLKRERWKHLLLGLYIMGIIVVSLMPGDLVPSSFSGLHLDKVGHFLAYTGLGFLICLTFLSRNGRLAATLFAIGLGFLLEWGQSFVPGRQMSFADGLVNTCGVFFGLLLFQLWGQSFSEWLADYLESRSH
jgi:VanZ family protein